MLIDGVLALLTGQVSGTNGAYAADIADIVGLTNARVYENELPRDYKFPAIAVHQYGETQDYDMAGPISVTEVQVQVDCYGKDSGTCRATAEAVTELLKKYVGTLPDGTEVLATYLERSQAMPFMANADSKGIANRWMMVFRFVLQS